MYLGGRGLAPGIGAFFLSLWVGPLAFVIWSARALGPQDLPAALFYSLYFLCLGLQNLLQPLALAIRPARRRSVVLAAAGLAAASVALVPFADVFRILELAEGERVRLEVGHLVWTLSFWLVAVAAELERRHGRVAVAGTPDDRRL